MIGNRVVVTGLGAVTPVGTGVKKFFSGLAEGQNGIDRVAAFDASDYRSKLAGEVKDFQAEDWTDAKSAKRMDRFTQFGLAASEMAFTDAGLDAFPFDKARAGVIIGSGIGGSQSLEEGFATLMKHGPGRLNPFAVSRMLINMAACTVSIKYGLMGPISAPSVACSTGSNAIGDAFRILQRGDADIMLAGSSEACITPLPYGCFCATRSMTPSDCPETGCRPFDRNRDGFVMGEGAGIVVLETLNHARSRGASVYCEVAGYGNTADAYHVTAPEPGGSGMIRVMQAALKDASMEAERIGYINAHGTSTVLNDRCESAAIESVFGEHAKSLKVSSIKSMIGHLLAAAGAVEFVSTALSVYTGIVPPTIHCTEPDEDCRLDYVTNGAHSMDLHAAMSNSFGFGGGNACLVIKKYGETDGDS
jgi:3-oxoacyl-[acyl-carrier-protein] synthase II